MNVVIFAFTASRAQCAKRLLLFLLVSGANCGAPEITISSIKASSATCDGCSSSYPGCDPRGPNMLISPCDPTVCQTLWGCGGSCTAANLVVNANGQGAWTSSTGSSENSGGQWLDLDLGNIYSVSKLDIWSAAPSKRFPQSIKILIGGSVNDGSTGGGNGCFEKTTTRADSDGWRVVAGPYVTGLGTSLRGCENAQSRASRGTQTDSDKCEVPVSGVKSRYIRIWLLGTAGNDDHISLRAIKVFGTDQTAGGQAAEYRLHLEDRWCDDGLLSGTGEVIGKLRSDCEALCNANMHCRFMLFGYDTWYRKNKCALFATCDNPSPYGTGNPNIYKKLEANTKRIETAEQKCSRVCSEHGYCCNDPEIGMHQLISCSQACMIRARGLSKTACDAACDRDSASSGCHATFDGFAYSFCSICLDCDSYDQFPLSNPAEACLVGCAVLPDTQVPTPAPPTWPTAVIAEVSTPAPATSLTPSPLAHPTKTHTELPTRLPTPSPTWTVSTPVSFKWLGSDGACDDFDCSDQVTDTVNKGRGVLCSHGAAPCNAVTCCEAPATCDTYDCRGRAANTVNRGSGVRCSGNASTCDASICCEESKRYSNGRQELNKQSEDGESSIVIALLAAIATTVVVAISCLAACYAWMRRQMRIMKNTVNGTDTLGKKGLEINTIPELCAPIGNVSATPSSQSNRGRSQPHEVVPAPHSKPGEPSSPEAPIKIIFSHSSRNKSPIATDIVETMISEFVTLGIPRQQIMYQYSMDIPPNRHWADVWMAGLLESEVVIVIMEQAYLYSEACVAEFLCSQDKDQAIVTCSSDELGKCRSMDPRNGATGCGQIVMQLKTGKQLYLNGPVAAARDIAKRYRAVITENGKSPGKPFSQASTKTSSSLDSACTTSSNGWKENTLGKSLTKVSL